MDVSPLYPVAGHLKAFSYALEVEIARIQQMNDKFVRMNNRTTQIIGEHGTISIRHHIPSPEELSQQERVAQVGWAYDQPQRQLAQASQVLESLIMTLAVLPTAQDLAAEAADAPD